MTAGGRTLWTIGYERFRVPEALRDALLAAGIERVVDVRAVPQSRRRGFGRRALQDLLADAGVVYEHRGELGNPAPMRALYKAGRVEAGREAFREHLRGGGLWAVDSLAGVLDDRPTVVLCREEDPAQCHRAVVIQELVARHPDVRVVRL